MIKNYENLNLVTAADYGQKNIFNNILLLGKDMNSNLNCTGGTLYIIKRVINRRNSKKVIRRYYNTSNLCYMYLVKKVFKKDKSESLRNYSANIKHVEPETLKNKHPKNIGICKEEDDYHYYDGDVDQVSITDMNYSHSLKLGGKHVGYDKKGDEVNLIISKGELITLKDQNDANDYADHLDKSYKDFNVTKNDKDIYNRTNECVLNFAKMQGLKAPKSLTDKDMNLNELTSLLRGGSLFKDSIKLFDEFNKKF